MEYGSLGWKLALCELKNKNQTNPPTPNPKQKSNKIFFCGCIKRFVFSHASSWHKYRGFFFSYESVFFIVFSDAYQGII